MLQALRGLADSLGVGFLAMQLIKLIGMLFSLVGPLKFVSSLFEGIFPVIANFFKVNFGWSINGMDVMAVAIAVGASLILWSCVAKTEPLKTKFFWRFLMLPYALIVIVLAIIVQVSTPIVEMNTFKDKCQAAEVDTTFYGSTCDEMSYHITFWDEVFGDAEIAETDTEDDEIAEGDFAGVSFMLALLYISLILPLIALGAFFFKRLSVNRLLRRVSIAVGTAGGLAIASAAFAGAMA